VEQAYKSPILSLKDLVRVFHQGTREIHVLSGASADFFPGQTVALVGPSGAGKSTLLHIIGLLETPDAGQVILADRDCGTLSDYERTKIRRTEIGFIYQFHQLLPEFSALENVILPQLIRAASWRQAEQRAAGLLRGLGLEDRAHHRPAELSGGEQQRVAIARAVANSPRLLLADEPTGNLDPHTAERVFGQLLNFVHRTGLAAIIATHNMDLAARMDRIITLVDGRLVDYATQRR
jgi:lipoprotein-releasing system ATP-binding protein